MKIRQSSPVVSIRPCLLFSLPTQNRAGFYQLCSNGHQIIVDDCCQIYGSHRLSQSIRCLRLYNYDEEEECKFELAGVLGSCITMLISMTKKKSLFILFEFLEMIARSIHRRSKRRWFWWLRFWW